MDSRTSPGLSFLFLGAATPACLDAADSDDSGEIDISDGALVTTFLFLGGRALPAPGATSCGPDRAKDEVSCLEYGVCD